MKSAVNMLRFVLLLFLFPVFQVYSSAYSANNDYSYRFNLLQIKTVGSEKPVILLLDNSSVLKAPPLLNMTVDTYQSRIAQLHWTTSDADMVGAYTIQRNAASAGWKDIATVPYTLLSYNDTISYPFCNPTNFSYRIQFVSSSGSDIALSPIVNATSPLSDLTSPENVSSLFVDLGPTIAWDPITTDSISLYEIQRYDPLTQKWPVVGSRLSSSNSFSDPGVNACENSYKYIVRTFDKCGNNSAPDYENRYVQNIILDVTQPGQCDKSVNLVWNSCKNMPGGLGGYKIYRNDGSSTVELDPVQATDTSYIDNFNFVNGQSYGYSVKGISINNSYSSSSCESFNQFFSAILPDTVYISQVNVENDNYISVGYYFTPASSSVVKLILERSDDNGSNFHAIDSILFPVPQQFHFNDTTANVHAQTYYYRLVAIDDCDNKTASINTSQSVWLKCSTSQTQNVLDWNQYKEWLQGVEGYEIYRVLDQDPATEVRIGNGGAATVTFSDPLTSYDQSKMACYWVESKENPGNPYLQNAISKSNTCCVVKDAILFMPNAFNPEGVNRLFRPVPSPLFVDTQSFVMTIFSRWGQQLFETSDMVNGWNGTINGQVAPAGQYSYLVTYKSLEGKDYSKRGTVMLIR